MSVLIKKKNKSKYFYKVISLILATSLLLVGCGKEEAKGHEGWVRKPGIMDEIEVAKSSLENGDMYLGNLDSISNLTKDQMKFDIYYLIYFLERYVPDFMIKKREGVHPPSKQLDYWFERVDELKNPFDFYILTREISNSYISSNTGLVSPFEFKNIIQFPNHPDEKVLNNARVILKNREYMELLRKSGWSDESKSRKREDNVFTGVTEDGKTAYLKIKSFDIEGIAEDGTVLGVKKFLSSLNKFSNFIIDIRENQSYSTEPWRNEIIPRLVRNEKTINTYVGYFDNKVAKNVFDYYLNMDTSVKNLTEKAVNNMFGLDRLDLKKVEKLPDYMYSTNFADLLKVKNFIEVKDIITPSESIQFKGRIFLLKDSQVLSSGDTFSYYLRTLGIGTSVGKSSKGDGIARTFGLRYLALPYSGLIYRVETGYGFNNNGSPNVSSGTPTDVYQENGPELDYVLNLIKNAKDGSTDNTKTNEKP